MSSRLKRMQTDIKTVTDVCGQDRHCPFKDFEVSENTVSFVCVKDGGAQHYTINLSEDYPEQTVLICEDNPHQPKVSDERLPVIINKLATDISYMLRFPLVDSPEEEQMDTNGPGQPEFAESDSEEYDSANDEYEDYDDYYDENDMSDEEDLHMHPLLAEDMERVRQLYGEASISHRLFGTIDDIDVELHIGMMFLDAEIAKAWKVIREEPIVIRLHLSLSRYLDATEPKVEIFQPSQKEKFGVGSQLRKIMECFISETWKTLSNDIVQGKVTKHVRPRKNIGSPPKKKFQTQLSNVETSSRPTETHLQSSVIDDHSMAKIVDMGFSADMARNALVITRGQLEEALNLLISSPDSCKGPPIGASGSSSSSTPSDTKADNKTYSLPTTVPKPPRPVRQHSYPKPTKDKGRNKGAGLRIAMAPSKPELAPSGPTSPSSPLEELNLLPSSTQSGMNAKQTPGLEHGFLTQVMRYARQRVPTLNEYCVVCDEPHVFQNGAMLKPAVCARELCVFAFQTLGVMSDAAEDIATGAEVVDLLIAMATSACKSHRRDIIFEPFPTVVDPLNPTELALHPKKKEYARVEKSLVTFPVMQNMTSLVGSELKKEMDKGDILAYPLLQWIITSNRSHIVKLPPEKQISFMHTPHQFLLMSSPPAKEHVFRAARQQFGSTFAFHGSHIENWHSIMRIGLINASGTKHQMHGAAYGNGIYLSPHASVSFGYSGMGYGTFKAQKANRPNQTPAGSSRFLTSKNLTCIALCEVITSKDIKKSGNIWVSPNPDHVCTRFFFVYEDGQVGDSEIDTQNPKYKKEILKAVGYQTG